MKYHMKVILTAMSVLLVFGACKKENSCPYAKPTVTATSNEILVLQNYLQMNSITATQDGSGLFYAVTSNGQGAVPAMCSFVTVKYKGSILTTGAIFDSTATGATASFELGGLINGWKYGLPKIKPGGKISLFIPPSLGYGSTPVSNPYGAVIIPANSYLRFDVELVNVE